MNMTAPVDYYETLGLTRAADSQELRKAYRKLALEYHPDRHPHDQRAEERFKLIAEAYSILGDPNKRAAYDQGFIGRLDLHLPRDFTCDCGIVRRRGTSCPGIGHRHELLRQKMRDLYRPGDRVFYNYWAYAFNSPAEVIGYPRPKPDNWQWIRLQFHSLKNRRNVPIYSERGWHLSKARLPEEQCYPLSHRMTKEAWEDMMLDVIKRANGL